MAIDERIQTLEDEFKLIKGELKQTLVNVHGFLVDLNLPALQEEGSISEIHMHSEYHRPGGEAPGPDSGSELSPPPPSEVGGLMPPEPMSQNVDQGMPSVSQMPPAGSPPPAEAAVQDQAMVLEDTTPFQEEEICSPPEAAEMVEQYQEEIETRGLDQNQGEPEQHEEVKVKEEVSQYASQVNLLANLIRWVSVAKREMSNGQLSAFLDVYSIGGHLSAEVREVILHLAETIAAKSACTRGDIALLINANPDAEPPTEAKTDMSPSPNSGADADVWSRLILELHGILSRGSASFHPLKMLWNGHSENEALQNKAGGETEDNSTNPQNLAVAKGRKLENKSLKKGKSKAKGKKSNDRPARLKLVLPISDGEVKEFSIGEFSMNLTSEGE